MKKTLLKRFLWVALSVSMLFIGSVSSAAASEKEPEVSTLSVDTRIPSLALPKEDILNRPIREDGSGPIYLGMEFEDFKSVAEEYGIDGIDYNRNTSGTISFMLDNNFFSFNNENDQLTEVSHKRDEDSSFTGKGIRYGSSLTDMIEAYGTDYAYTPPEYVYGNSESESFYEYTFDGMSLRFMIGVKEGGNEDTPLTSENKMVIEWTYRLISDTRPAQFKLPMLDDETGELYFGMSMQEVDHFIEKKAGINMFLGLETRLD